VYGQVDLYYIYYRPEDSFQFEEITVNSVNNRLEHNVSKAVAYTSSYLENTLFY